MDAHQCFFGRIERALDQRQMHFVRGLVGISVQGEGTVARGQRARTGAPDQSFMLTAVMDEIGDGANLKAVVGGEFLEFRQARHGAVFAHDFANHRGRT